MILDEAIDCDSTFDEVTKDGTIITSPNYPSAYTNSLDCEITIRFASDETVRIILQEFDVELHRDCDNDYLSAHDGSDTNSPMIGFKMCGTSPEGLVIDSTGNVMTLNFHSDSSQTKTGFKAYAHAVKGKYIFLISIKWKRFLYL